MSDARTVHAMAEAVDIVASSVVKIRTPMVLRRSAAITSKFPMINLAENLDRVTGDCKSLRVWACPLIIRSTWLYEMYAEYDGKPCLRHGYSNAYEITPS
jgi:hypothetical protein